MRHRQTLLEHRSRGGTVSGKAARHVVCGIVAPASLLQHSVIPGHDWVCCHLISHVPGLDYLVHRRWHKHKIQMMTTTTPGTQRDDGLEYTIPQQFFIDYNVGF